MQTLRDFGARARVEVFIDGSIRLCMRLGESEVIAAVVQHLRSPGLAIRTSESSSGASAAGAFGRIEFRLGAF